MGYNLHAECSTYIQSNITSEVQYKPVSKLKSYPIDKLEKTDEEEDVSLAFLPSGPSKLVFSKVNNISYIKNINNSTK